MDPISILFNEIIYNPIFNLLVVFLSLTWWNLWLSIIFLTLSIRLILLKPTIDWANMQKEMTDFQPKIQEIQEKYKDNPQKQSEEMIKLFKTKWAWPLKWCLMILVQIPVFIWLFFVIKSFAENHIKEDVLYSFFYHFWHNYVFIENINNFFLWMNLFDKWNFLLWMIACILMYLQIQLTMANKSTNLNLPWWAGIDMKQVNSFMEIMNIMLIIMMWIFVLSVPSWIWIYIIATTLFWVIQYLVQYKELYLAKLNLFLSKFKK